MTKLWLIIAILACFGTAAWGLSIFDIQYTLTPGIDNTYPSLYVGRLVSLEGIVTATGYRDGGFFISESTGGPYRGILILDRSSSVHIGDKIQVTGTVSESYGMTCLRDLTKIRVLDSNHPLPYLQTITTGQISSPDEAEAYEALMVKVQNTSCSSLRGGRGKFHVTDGSGQCPVNITSFHSINFNPAVGTQFSSISGIVIYSFSEYSLNAISGTSIALASPVYNQSRSWGKIKSIYK